MAITEACQVWIEQRIQEELADKPESGKSLRAIGRELAAEIERIFDAKMNPRGLETRARRMGAPNGAPAASPQPTTENGADSADNLTPEMIVSAVEKKVKEGKSVREATKELATVHGKKPEAIHRSYSREKERINRELKGSVAQHFAARAGMTL